MRKLLVTSVLALSIASQAKAASNWDGLYYCNVAAQGITGAAATTYVAINSKSATSAIFTIPALTPTNTFYGTGVGVISTDSKANTSGMANNSFKGTTNMSNPFNFNLDKFNVIRGTITISYAPTSIKVNAVVACTKSW